jgi:hypothetical protein
MDKQNNGTECPELTHIYTVNWFLTKCTGNAVEKGVIEHLCPKSEFGSITRSILKILLIIDHRPEFKTKNYELGEKR